MLFDLFLADFECFFFFLSVFFNRLTILIIRHADDRFQRLYHFLVLHFARAAYNAPKLHAARSLYDHIVTLSDLQLSRSKIVNLSGSPESDTDYFRHIVSSPLSSAGAAPSPAQS